MNGAKNLTVVVVVYGFIAILFQLFSHIFERIKIKKLDKAMFPKNVFIIIISFILSLVITQCLVPVPT